MPRRYNAQRKHIIYSLDTLLYQFHCLSFLLSPSLFTLLLRSLSQVICTAPRESSPTCPLGGFFGILLFFNGFSVWNHAIKGATEGRAIILDFVGLAYTPSKFQLLLLDFTIIFLQMLLTTISFDMHTSERSAHDTPVHLLPTPTPTPQTSETSASLEHSLSTQKISEFQNTDSQYVIDVQLSSILSRLRSAPTIIRSSSRDTLLPMPNTTSWPLSIRMTRLMQQNGPGQAGTTGNANQRSREARDEARTLPGGMDTTD